MNKGSIVFVIGLTSLVAAAGTALAGDKKWVGHHRMHDNKMFEEIDKNADGKISKEESELAATSHFEKTDNDDSGSISLEELSAAMEARRANHLEKMFAHLDKDADGSVTSDEFTHRGNWFADADADDDGYLTKDEIRDHHKERKDRHRDGH